MQAYIEDGIERKSVVPYHWVNSDDSVLLWPPKGKPAGEYIRKWVKPQINWISYKITKCLLEYGSKKRCEEFLRSHVDSSAQEESASDPDRTITGSK